jgi:hypothetical protein
MTYGIAADRCSLAYWSFGDLFFVAAVVGVLSVREWTWCSLCASSTWYLTSWILKTEWEILVPQDENRINYSKLTDLDHLMYTEPSDSCLQFNHLFWVTPCACCTLNSGWFDGFAVFMFEALLCWWLVYFSFLLLHNCSQVSSVFGLCHSISCLVSCVQKSHGMSLQLGHSVTSQFISRIARWN